MAPLSKQLSGVVIPHDQFGTHLNSSGKTINQELENKNFQFAGETLAEEFLKLWDPCHSWYINHVRESQYFLQVHLYK